MIVGGARFSDVVGVVAPFDPSGSPIYPRDADADSAFAFEDEFILVVKGGAAERRASASELRARILDALETILQ